MNTASERLRAKLDAAYPVLGACAARMWTSDRARELYPAYLATMHAIVRSAVPLMEAAREQAQARAADDRVSVALVTYLTHHIPEETGHDAWILEDLAAAGGDADSVRRRMPSPRVASLVGAQYYWLRHHHPVTLLGHIAAIEGNHPPLGFAARLREATGYGRDAFRAIERHEILDIRHKRELYEFIDSLPLDPEQERAMGVSALHTIQAGIEVLEEIWCGPTAVRPAMGTSERRTA